VALETRANNRRYFYRYHRTNDGRVVKEYIAAGQEALIAAEAASQERQQREAARAAERQKLAQINEAIEPLAAFETAFKAMLEAALSASGL
jgi:hypothetical protein